MNKMENTSENKARFFALHYGQRFTLTGDYNMSGDILGIKTKDVGSEQVFTDKGFLYLKDCAVSLRSISSLTDHEIRHLAKWYGYDEIIGDVKNMLEFKKELEAIVNEGLEAKPYLFDYLRSIGILIPWMNLSVDEIINYGWAVVDKEVGNGK